VPEATDTRQPAVRSTPTRTPVISIADAQVIDVIDGDTIRVLINGVDHTVRYIGIDAPETEDPAEPVQRMSREATEANRDLVEGKTVLLEKDVSETDRYGRLLRYVFVGDTFVNHELVRLGFAEAKAYPPDTRYRDLLAGAEREARAASRGVWAPLLLPPDCLDADYVADVTVPDDTRIGPGETFVKTWRVSNTGSCPWPSDTQLLVVSDGALISQDSADVGTTEPEDTIDISVEMTAPSTEGRYTESWRLSTGDDRFFGSNLTVVIEVTGAP
jgi:endonuclease YncB( thermonuclease family)